MIKKKFHVGYWITLLTATSFIAAVALVIIFKSNLWPLTVILITFSGFIFGGMLGGIFKLFNVSHKLSIVVYAILTSASLLAGIYVFLFFAKPYGSVIEGTYLVCSKTTNDSFLGMPASEITLFVKRQRQIYRYFDKRFKYDPWEEVNKKRTYIFLAQHCPSSLPNEEVVFRHLNGYLYNFRERDIHKK